MSQFFFDGSRAKCSSIRYSSFLLKYILLGVFCDDVRVYTIILFRRHLYASRYQTLPSTSSTSTCETVCVWKWLYWWYLYVTCDAYVRHWGLCIFRGWTELVSSSASHSGGLVLRVSRILFDANEIFFFWNLFESSLLLSIFALVRISTYALIHLQIQTSHMRAILNLEAFCSMCMLIWKAMATTVDHANIWIFDSFQEQA